MFFDGRDFIRDLGIDLFTFKLRYEFLSTTIVVTKKYETKKPKLTQKCPNFLMHMAQKVHIGEIFGIGSRRPRSWSVLAQIMPEKDV